MSHILWALSPPNRLVCEWSLATGWRVDDVLALKTEQIERALKGNHRVAINEKKTGKRSVRFLSGDLIERTLEQAGRVYAFQHRDDYRRHRTRQAVFADIKKAAVRFNIKLNLSPHSLRKNYAVWLRKQGKSLDEIQTMLNHENRLTTIIYALSDELTERYK